MDFVNGGAFVVGSMSARDRYPALADDATDNVSVAGCDEYRLEAGPALDEIDRLTAENVRFREHSTTLNSISWAIHEAMGLIPDDAEEHQGNIMDDLPEICRTLREARPYACIVEGRYCARHNQTLPCTGAAK